MKVIPIVTDTLVTIPKSLVKELDELEIGGRSETIKTTALFRSVRIMRRVLETLGDLMSLISKRLCEKLIVSYKIINCVFYDSSTKQHFILKIKLKIRDRITSLEHSQLVITVLHVTLTG